MDKAMYFRFQWAGPGELKTQLTAGISGYSIETTTHRRPTSVTLWRVDGSGLLIRNVMHDVAPRREVGTLEFSVATRVSDPPVHKLPPSFAAGVQAQKLVITEGTARSESGIFLTGSDGQTLTIVSGVIPFSLAVCGQLDLPHACEPEYPLEEYVQAPFV